jgi:hypothetical protein
LVSPGPGDRKIQYKNPVDMVLKVHAAADILVPLHEPEFVSIDTIG